MENDEYVLDKLQQAKRLRVFLITLGAYLAPFDIPEVNEIVQYDELEFDNFGDSSQKSILYIIISDTDTTYNFLPAMIFTQIFNVLCEKQIAIR